MKNIFPIFKLCITICLCFLTVTLTGCGDAEPLVDGIENNPIPDKPIVHDEELIDKLKDTTQAVEGITFTPDQLKEISPELATFSGSMTMYAFPGRSKEKTRPIIVFSQSLFGQDISHPLHDYILSLDAQTKEQNTFIVINGLKNLLDTTRFMLTKGSDPAKAGGNTKKASQQVTITSYNDISKYALDLFSNDHNITDIKDLGTLTYMNNSRGSVMLRTGDAISKSLNILKDELHFNRQKVALIAFDPFISGILQIITILEDTSKLGKITHIAAVPAMLAMGEGKSYPDDEDDLDTSYLNLGYKIDLVNINNGSDTNLKKKLAFDILRLVPNSFFLSLADMQTLSYKNYRGTLIKDIEFYIALGGDKATDTEATLKGQKLILDDNVTNRKIGFYSMIDNPAINLKTSVVTLSGPDYNFPGNNDDAKKIIGGTNGLVKYIVDQNK